MGRLYTVMDDETGTCRKKFKGLDKAVENGKKPVAITVKYACKVSKEIRKKLKYRLVDKTEKGPGPMGMPVLIAEGEGLRYISNPSGPKTEVHYGLVHMEDEAKGEVRVFSTNNYMLYPDFSYDPSKPVEVAETVDKAAEASYRDKRDGLVEAFGGTKGNRLVRSRKRNALVCQERVESDIAQVVNDSVSLLTLNVLQEENSAVDYIPPYHDDATRPEDVYLFMDLLNKPEIDSLSTPAQVFMNSDFKQIQEWKQNKTYSSFVLKYLEMLPGDREARSGRCIILMYYHILLYVWNMKYADWRRKNHFPAEFPSVIRKKIEREFVKTTPGTSAKYATKDMKDKTLLYLCVVALIMSDFSLDMSAIEEDTGRKLKLYFEQLGCTISYVKSKPEENVKVQRAVLKVPLTFPKLKASSRGQKRRAT